MITLEFYRNPIRLELVRHVIPIVIFLGLICVGIGYAWAMAAFRSGL